MASISGLGKIPLPKFGANMDPEDARAIRNYLTQLQEQMQYLLTNLDEDNLSAELRQKWNR